MWGKGRASSCKFVFGQGVSIEIGEIYIVLTKMSKTIDIVKKKKNKKNNNKSVSSTLSHLQCCVYSTTGGNGGKIDMLLRFHLFQFDLWPIHFSDMAFAQVEKIG